MGILFSIIIPIYNAGHQLKKTLNTFIFPMYSDYELILVNDGSKDNSLEICNEYSKKYRFIKTINQKNAGCVAARKKGISISKAKYIVFADADDYVMSDYMKLLHKTVENKADVYILNNKINIPNTLSFEIEKNFLKNGYIEKAKVIDWVVSGKAGAVWDKIFSGKLVRNNLQDIKSNFTYGDDVYINLLLLQDAKRIYVNDISPYLHVRDSEGSVCNSIDIRRLKEINNLYIEGKIILKKLNVDSQIINNFATVEISNYAKTIVDMLKTTVSKEDIYRTMDNSELICDLNSIDVTNKSGKFYKIVLEKRTLRILCFACNIRTLIYKLKGKAK